MRSAFSVQRSALKAKTKDKTVFLTQYAAHSTRYVLPLHQRVFKGVKPHDMALFFVDNFVNKLLFAYHVPDPVKVQKRLLLKSESIFDCIVYGLYTVHRRDSFVLPQKKL